MAFTDYETEQLRRALLKETRHCAVTLICTPNTRCPVLRVHIKHRRRSFFPFYFIMAVKTTRRKELWKGIKRRESAGMRAQMAAGMTQEQMAAALGCSQKDVSRWERGVHSPRVDVLIKMADVLGCRIDDLIDRSRE